MSEENRRREDERQEKLWKYRNEILKIWEERHRRPYEPWIGIEPFRRYLAEDQIKNSKMEDDDFDRLFVVTYKGFCPINGGGRRRHALCQLLEGPELNWERIHDHDNVYLTIRSTNLSGNILEIKAVEREEASFADADSLYYLKSRYEISKKNIQSLHLMGNFEVMDEGSGRGFSAIWRSQFKSKEEYLEALKYRYLFG